MKYEIVLFEYLHLQTVQRSLVHRSSSSDSDMGAGRKDSETSNVFTAHEPAQALESKSMENPAASVRQTNALGFIIFCTLQGVDALSITPSIPRTGLKSWGQMIDSVSEQDGAGFCYPSVFGPVGSQTALPSTMDMDKSTVGYLFVICFPKCISFSVIVLAQIRWFHRPVLSCTPRLHQRP